MAASLATSIALDVLSELTLTADLTPSGGNSPTLQRLQAKNVLRNGTGSGLADKVWADTRQVAASGTDSLDLVAGGLLDVAGAAFTLAKLKVIVVRSRDTNNSANNLEVTRPASNGVPWAKAAGDAVPLGPGGLFVWTGPLNGVTVTADTGDLLNLVNSAGTNALDYDIVLVGTSA